MSRARARAGAIAAVTLGTLLIVATACRTGPSDEEIRSYDYGRRVLLAGRFDPPAAMDAAPLPVLALHALPERLGAPLPLRAGRLVNLLFYVGLCLLVFAWGMEVYGPAGALAATALIAFVPPLLGYSARVTADAAGTGLIFAAVYALSRCLLDPSLERSLVAGVAGGLALLSRFSALALAPLALVLVLLRTFTAERLESRRRVLHGGMAAVVIAAIVALLVLSAGFGFRHPITRLREIPCRSRALQATRSILGDAPLPLPRGFLTGLDHRLARDRSATAWVDALGAAEEPGSSSPFAIVALLGTLLPLLLLLLIRPWRWHRRYSDLTWLAPALWSGIPPSLSACAPVSPRSLLPAFPFLALLAAAAWDAQRSRRWRQVATALVLIAIAAAVWICPRYLTASG